MYYNWGYLAGDKGNYNFEFKSGSKISFEWCTGELQFTQNGKTTQISVKNRDSDVDRGQVPMAVEYVEMVTDAINFFQNSHLHAQKNALIPFIATMEAYQKGKVHYQNANL